MTVVPAQAGTTCQRKNASHPVKARFAKLILCATLAFASMASHAHRFHVGLTDISFNERTGSTEVVHTYMAHDVEALLTNLYQREFDLSQPEDQQVLRQYVERQFWIRDQAGNKLPLRWVGMTVDTDSVVIYQEAERTPLSRAALVHDEVMIDFLPDQVNTVNLRAGATTRTFTFDGKHAEHPVR